MNNLMKGSGNLISVAKQLFDIISIFFVVYLIGYSTFLFISVMVGSSTMYSRRKKEKMKNTLMEDYYVPVSILVPAYNEEVTVVQTVKSLLCLEYKLFEIVVIDDGSTDKTASRLIDNFNMHKVNKPIRVQLESKPVKEIFETVENNVKITLIKKENGGKADSLNMGINASEYPYFICMDADSALQYDSLEKIVRPVLENSNVVAVGGAVRPSNDVVISSGKVNKYNLPKKLLPCMQVLEYDRSFLAARILFDKFNGNLIISGAFGLFKKNIVIAAGGYDSKTMGEDMELIVKLHEFCRLNSIKYKIKYEPDAICWSQVPEKLSDLKKQRKRWHLGLYQTMKKHSGLFVNPRYGLVSLVSYLYFLIYELLSPFIEMFGMITIIIAFLFQLVNIQFMLMFFVIYAVFGSMLSITAFFARIHTIDLSVSIKDTIRVLFLCFFEVSCLRFVLAFVRATAFIGYKDNKMNWGKIERTENKVK